MKKGSVVLWLALLFTGIITLFWRTEWVYSQPTPVPKNYKPVNAGGRIPAAQQWRAGTNKPLFLHFFNPDCPCSRFNISHFKTLAGQYGKEVNFEIVVMSNKHYSAGEIQDRFGLALPVLFDSTIAVACGVYSTPQAVLIDTDDKLYYRGNYNKARYCTDSKSEYAKMALDSLLHHRHLTVDRYASTAYGCQLPMCTK